MKSDRIRAFTLIEFIIALFVISIIYGITFVSSNAYDSYLEKMEVKLFIRDIQNTRTYAMNNKLNTKISLRNSSNIYKIKYQAKEGINKALGRDLKFSPAGILELQFNPRGVPSETNTITIIGKEVNYNITCNIATGKINVSVIKKWKRQN